MKTAERRLRGLRAFLAGLAAIAVAAPLVYAGYTVWAVGHAFAIEDEDWLTKWPQFRREHLSAYLVLPNDATPIFAHRRTGFMDETLEVRFRLPNTKTPEDWLERIATTFAGGDGMHRKGRYAFQADSRHYDLGSLDYEPSTGVYHVEAGWD